MAHSSMKKKSPINFTKTHLEPSMINLIPFSKLILGATFQGYQKRYITLSYLIWLKNGGSSNFEVSEKVEFTK